MLLHVPDVLTSDELRTLRSLLDEAAWRDGRATAGTQAVQAKNNEQIATGTDTAQAAQQLVLQALHRNPLFFSAALPRKIFPPQFNRYGGETNFYGDHVDGPDFSFTVPRGDLERASTLLREKVLPQLGTDQLVSDAHIAKVSIVGIGMRSQVGVASTMFRTLSEEGINIKMISTSEIKTSVVIDEKYVELAVRALHKAFGLDA